MFVGPNYTILLRFENCQFQYSFSSFKHACMFWFLLLWYPSTVICPTEDAPHLQSTFSWKNYKLWRKKNLPDCNFRDFSVNVFVAQSYFEKIIQQQMIIEYEHLYLPVFLISGLQISKLNNKSRLSLDWLCFPVSVNIPCFFMVSFPFLLILAMFQTS